MSRLAGKNVVVTGGAQGIGAAYVRRLAGAGASVIVADRNTAGAEEVAAAVEADGGTARAVELDLGSVSSCASFANQVASTFGAVHGLINNAAIFSTIQMKPFWEIDIEEWDRLMAVNLRGPWLLVGKLLPSLKAAGDASVINVGSDAVAFGRTGYLHYTSSKAGVQGMTYGMARELGPFGIRVNTLSPGPVYTEVARETVTEAQKTAMLAMSAIKRTANPDDMTGLACFLLSDDSSYITGQTISVNGGLVHH